jgi:hypothetical protein
MKAKFALAVLVCVLATVLVASFASAALDFHVYNVKINDLDAYSGQASVVAGETYPVSIKFLANENASDVVVSAWVQGERSESVDREFYDLIDGSRYDARLSLTIPENIDPEEELTWYLRIETDSGNWEEEFSLKGQRQSNNLEVLLVDMENEVKAGETVAVSVALRNMGRQDAEDVLVTVRIPELGVSRSAYFEDLFPLDDCDDDDDDCSRSNTREKTIFVSVPESAKAGLYQVEVVAESDDAESKVIKELRVRDTVVSGNVLTNPSSKTFSVGEEAVYNLVLVNSGDNIQVFNLVPQSSDALSISLSESFVAIPAGSSETVKVYVKSNREGTFNFAVEATADGFSQTAQYSATVQGRSITGGNNVVALTIVLAIIFVVLVIILIVLLTRKPEKTEEFGESYY